MTLVGYSIVKQLIAIVGFLLFVKLAQLISVLPRKHIRIRHNKKGLAQKQQSTYEINEIGGDMNEPKCNTTNK